MRNVPSFETTTSIQYRVLVFFEFGSTATSLPCAENSAGIWKDTESEGHMVRSADDHASSCPGLVGGLPDKNSRVLSSFMPMKMPTPIASTPRPAAAA